MDVLPETAVNDLPVVDVAIAFVPYPTATNCEPFQVIPCPEVDNIPLPSPVHILPSLDHAIVFTVLVPPPVATHSCNDDAQTTQVQKRPIAFLLQKDLMCKQVVDKQTMLP